MKQKYYNLSTPFSGHIRFYTCNKFGHVPKECGNKSMDLHRQHGKKSDKNIISKRPEKDGSTNTSHNNQKEEEKKRCGLALCSFEDEEELYIDSKCSHHMTRDKDKFEFLKKNKDGKVILENSAPTKVMGKGRIKLEKCTKAADVLLVQGIKKNILNLGQLANKGLIIIFTSTK